MSTKMSLDHFFHNQNKQRTLSVRLALVVTCQKCVNKNNVNNQKKNYILWIKYTVNYSLWKMFSLMVRSKIILYSLTNIVALGVVDNFLIASGCYNDWGFFQSPFVDFYSTIYYILFPFSDWILIFQHFIFACCIFYLFFVLIYFDCFRSTSFCHAFWSGPNYLNKLKTIWTF